MDWQGHYVCADKALWQGRVDSPEGACFFQIIRTLDLKQLKPNKNPLAFALLGFCCDEGIRRNHGRTGAAEGPRHIRQMLAKLSIHRDIDCYDAGDIICVDQDLEKAQLALRSAVAHLIEQGYIPIVLGGGHEVAFGHFMGISDAYPHQKIGVVNFDAHLDMRPLLPEERGSSGTPFLQIAEWQKKLNLPFRYYCIGIQAAGNTRSLFATAKAFDTTFFLADDLYQGKNEQYKTFIENILNKDELLYLSLCLDVFSEPFAPGVSAPQPLGLHPWHVIPALRQLASSGKVVSYDLAELSPPHDISERTAKLAALLIFEIIHSHKKRQSS
ncbi:MAG: formimidoylglutamase [Gammaproteobacteria bacterium]|nr:formimidoylglutamase [Gammaproteobacteria bacterium]